MDLAVIEQSIGEIAQIAKASGVKIDKQLGEMTTHSRAQDARILDLEQKVLTGKSASSAGGGSGRMTLGSTIANDPQLDLLRKGTIRQAMISQRASLATLCKSVLVETGTSGTSPELGFPVPPEYLGLYPANAPGRRLQVLQALPHQQVSAGSAIVPQLSSTSDGSAVQIWQGNAKSESTLAVHPQTLPMATIATFLNASRQLLDDIATLPTFLQNWLSYLCLRRYETLIVSGDGTSTDGHITGLLNAGTAFTSSQTYNADKIADAAFTALPSFGYGCDLILISSSDYLGIITQRATTEQYVGGGWGAPNPGTLWGIRAIPTPALSAGHAICCDTQLISILDRQEISFLIGTTGTQFTENLFTYLAELRGQLAIGDPHAVQVVALA